MPVAATTATLNVKRDQPAAQPYRPKVGEILVKDSILYSQKPAAVRHLRRQLWPIMENTMDTIAKGVATGAKILHHMMRPNLIVTGEPVYVRRVPTKSVAGTLHIKNVYMPQALTGLMQPLRHPRQPKKAQATVVTTTTTTVAPFKMPKPTMIVVGEQPVNTISDAYVLRYNGGVGTDPSYTIRSHSKPSSPFADMGVTGYKHFEATVLRELEEKEERKVEESMRRLPEGDSDNETHDWQPMMSVSSTLKPREESRLHTNTSGQDIKPVHEEVQETKGMPVGVNAPKLSRYLARKPHKPTVVATVAPTTPSPPNAQTTGKPTTTVPTLLDVPNYPDFFIQQNRHLMPVPRANANTIGKTKSGTEAALAVKRTTTEPPPKSDDLNSVLDFGRYRMHFQHIGAAAPQQRKRGVPEVSHGQDMDVSQSQSKSTVLVSARPVRISNRQAPQRSPPAATDSGDGASTAADGQRPTTATAAGSRGKVKFGDRVESR